MLRLWFLPSAIATFCCCEYLFPLLLLQSVRLRMMLFFAAFVCALTIKASLTAASNPTAFYFKPLPGQFQVLFRLLAVQLAKTNPDLND
jgi:hypothetical protein